MRKLTLALLAFILVALPAAAEIWNDPGGVAVTATSQTVDFPRAMKDVLIHDDDTSNEIFVRIFLCGETTGVAVAGTHLEIKPTKSESFRHSPDTESGRGYCAISLVCSGGETAAARIHAK